MSRRTVGRAEYRALADAGFMPLREYAAGFGGYDEPADESPKAAGRVVNIIAGVAIGAVATLCVVAAYHAGTWAFGL